MCFQKYFNTCNQKTTYLKFDIYVFQYLYFASKYGIQNILSFKIVKNITNDNDISK